MPRLIFRLCVVALLCCGLSQPLGAAAAPPHWQAVLVAGDNAEPVFDNAVDMMAGWLVHWGVPAAEIHRLSASQTPQEGAEPASSTRILQRIAALRPQPGQGCFVFVTSHGKHDQGVWLAASSDFLTPPALAQALATGCGSAPTVVIISACYSGVFVGGPMRAPNRVILTAARADRPSFGCQADRTYTVFDECLLATLPHATTWKALYKTSVGCVRQREQSLNVYPSEPRKFFGSAVATLAIH